MAAIQFTSAPLGLKPVSRRGSALISPAIQKMNIHATNTISIGANEIVSNSLAGYIQAPSQPAGGGYAGIHFAGGANALVKFLGVLSGVYFRITSFPGEMRQVYWKQATPIITGTPITADVLYDPEIEYEIQVGPGQSLVQTDIGAYSTLGNINFIDGSLSGSGAAGITLGQSNAFLDRNAVNTNDPQVAATDVQIIALSPRPQNTFGLLNNYAIVKINTLAFAN